MPDEQRAALSDFFQSQLAGLGLFYRATTSTFALRASQIITRVTWLDERECQWSRPD
ncbi:MAG: hypothetical protein AB2792_19150 [Candidatus Thiodiazotropha sp.]